MKNLKRRILHLFFPNKCPICGEIIEENDEFCSACPEKFTVYQGNFCVSGADGYCASFEYNDTISPAIKLLKDGICGNAAYALGNSLAHSIGCSSFSDKFDFIIPVPMHRKDKLKRGYNQAELIACAVSERLKVTVLKNAVIKSAKTQMQKNLTAKERAENLSGAFTVKDSAIIKRKSVLIIDDVCTTGSTLRELTMLLKSSGASKVYCASCCKTPEIAKNKEV